LLITPHEAAGYCEAAATPHSRGKMIAAIDEPEK
jgi:hypothetical protein